MSREIRVALLAIAAIALCYWGYKFILGKNVLVNSNIYLVEYDDIGGMQTSTPVRINGVQIGFVSEIKNLMEEQKVLVTLDLNKEIRLPKSTMAYIKTETFMGAKAVELVYDTPCSGDDCAKSGEYIQGKALGMLSSMLTKEELKEYLKSVTDGLGDLVDTISATILSGDAEGPIANSLKDMESTMGNLKNASAQFNGLLYKSSDKIEAVLANTESITGNLKDNNEQVKSIITNTDKFTKQLAEVDINQTVSELQATITQLKEVLGKADAAVNGINGIVGNIQSGEGTLGKLIEDPELYNHIVELSSRADSLISELKDHPYKYIPLKSRNKVKRYERKDEAEEEQ